MVRKANKAGFDNVVEYILHLVREHGNQYQAAKAIDVSPNTLRHHLKKAGIALVCSNLVLYSHIRNGSRASHC